MYIEHYMNKPDFKTFIQYLSPTHIISERQGNRINYKWNWLYDIDLALPRRKEKEILSENQVKRQGFTFII